MTIKTPRIVNVIKDSYYVYKAVKAEVEYDAMIAASQAKLAEGNLIPGVVQIYA